MKHAIHLDFAPSEHRETAEAMVAGGYKAAGYEYVNLDACWNTPGTSDADPERFPSGMKALARRVVNR